PGRRGARRPAAARQPVRRRIRGAARASYAAGAQRAGGGGGGGAAGGGAGGGLNRCKLEPGMSTRRTFLFLLSALLCAGCSLFRPKPGPRPLYKKLSPSISYEMMRDSPQMLVIDLRPP